MTATDTPTEAPRAPDSAPPAPRRQPTWFDEQLAIAGRRTATWPDWARREAGLPVLLTPEESESDGPGRGGVWTSKVCEENR